MNNTRTTSNVDDRYFNSKVAQEKFVSHNYDFQKSPDLHLHIVIPAATLLSRIVVCVTRIASHLKYL